MAAFKFTFLLCAVLLVVQTQARPQSTQYGDIDIVGFLKKAEAKVEQVLDKALDAMTEFVNKVTADTLDDVQAETVDVTRKVMNKVMDKIIKDINQMGEHSGATGQKLAGCITSSRDDIVEVPVSFWNDVSKCESKDILSLAESMKPLIKDITDIHADGKAAAEKINGCGEKDYLCVLEVAGEVLGVVAKIPEAISEKIKPVIANVKTLVAAVKQCIKDEVPVYFKLAGATLDKVATCMAA